MHPSQFSLAGKNILVTGASSGIGRETAIQCSRSGARVIIFGRNEERLEETLSMMEQPGIHRKVLLDLTEFDAVEATIKELSNECGRFHGLVNAAGISTTLPLKMTKPDKLEHYFRVNVTSALYLSGLFSKKGIADDNGASIILLASVMGMAGTVGKTIYSATKGALISAARSMAVELAPRKIRVNTISPGVVVTPMTDNAIYNRDEESRQQMVNLHPLGLGTPVDIANACIYMLSDASRWITGTNLVVDGGYTAV